ncbi:PLDc N-terminal domain-containing protein [Curtobacterium sp. RRHDQ10]|uniref:PLDc N-terminal domain-containing protein n=1 Tax=Curtobacterium phyllosphaerae TaxID=3413379 RepID=UPI003BF40D7F
MVRLLVVGVVAAIAFTVYAVIDCATMPRPRVRALNKLVWVVVIVVLPVLGGILWFLLGRAPANRVRTGGPLGPDDDPDFLGATRTGMTPSEKEQSDATLRNLEQQLADPDEDSGAAGRHGRDRPAH